MKHEEKLSKIRSLSEDKLRKNVLIPLFISMGFCGVKEYHGPGERGKDIIFNEVNMLGETEYTAVIAKTERIHGSVGKLGSVANIVDTQVKQALNEPYVDYYEIKELYVHKCLVITSNDIVSSCVESIYETLKNSGLARSLKFYDGHWLVQQIDRFMKTYFEEKDRLELVIEQQKKMITDLQETKVKAVGLIYEMGRQYDTSRYVLDANAASIGSAATPDQLAFRVSSSAPDSIANYSERKITKEEILHKFVDAGIIKSQIKCPFCGSDNSIDPKKLFILCDNCGKRVV